MSGDRYMACFFRTYDERLHLAHGDGRAFHAVSSPLHASRTGSLRDPSPLYRDETLYVAYTTGRFGEAGDFSSFDIAASLDLCNWDYPITVNLGAIPGVNRVWAPEWCSDGANVAISVAVSTNGNDGPFTTYVVRPLNASLTEWTSPQPVIGLPPNVIDTAIVKISDEDYRIFYKNETTKFVEQARATSFVGPYAVVGSDDWARWGDVREGPVLVSTSAGWRIYLDAYREDRMLYSDALDDNLERWSEPVPVE